MDLSKVPRILTVDFVNESIFASGYAGAPAGYPTGAGGPPPQGYAQQPQQTPYGAPGYPNANTSQAYPPTSQYYRVGLPQINHE
jgi:hypothetical protein